MKARLQEVVRGEVQTNEKASLPFYAFIYACMQAFIQQILIECAFSVDPAIVEFVLLWGICQMMVYPMVKKNRHKKENCVCGYNEGNLQF